MNVLKKIVPQPIKNIYHLGQAILANFMYGWPAKNIKVIGITGTDGKTTTAQMIAAILEEAGKKVAMASTINYRMAGREWKNLSHFTTLSAVAVQKFILDAVKERCEYLVLETSSHSIDQFRTWGIPFRTAVITNVTREHLDYHKTLGNYRLAKTKIFRKAKIAVVNLDMDKPEEFLQFKNDKKIKYSLKNSQAEILAENVELNLDNSKFKIKDTEFKLDLIGDFNVENALAAISVGVSEGIDLAACARALVKIQTVPGRMESVPNDKGINIIVDFALTPNAMEKLYKLLDKIRKPGAKIIAVFGACGERDRGKRPIIGEIVSRFADYVIITNDDPYGEDPLRIIDEIVAGIKNKKTDESLLIIPDRREAIRKALQLAHPDDIVAVTGMGAEESMIVAGEKIPWNDKKVILEELQALTFLVPQEK